MTNPIIVPGLHVRTTDLEPIAVTGQSFEIHEWSGSGPDHQITRRSGELTLEKMDYSLRPADRADAQAVAALVHHAYGHYVERIGFPPRPMTEDYIEVIANRQVTVAVSQRAIVGVIVLDVTDEGFLIDNVAVDPSQRGKGLGKALLEFAEAEARRAGFDSIYLYTHEKMTENIALYSRIGYIEYDRRSQGGFSLVYMRKRLEKHPN